MNFIIVLIKLHWSALNWWRFICSQNAAFKIINKHGLNQSFNLSVNSVLILVIHFSNIHFINILPSSAHTRILSDVFAAVFTPESFCPRNVLTTSPPLILCCISSFLHTDRRNGLQNFVKRIQLLPARPCFLRIVGDYVVIEMFLSAGLELFLLSRIRNWSLRDKYVSRSRGDPRKASEWWNGWHSGLPRICAGCALLRSRAESCSSGYSSCSNFMFVRYRIRHSYGLDGPGIESRWGREFPHTSRPDLGPTQPPITRLPGLFPGVWSGRGVALTIYSHLTPRLEKE